MDSAHGATLGMRSRDRQLAWSVAVPLFGTTLFLGSFLMFMVEPMIAKMVLPILGGAAMVWNTCVVFFQIVLLAGYAYAHGAALWVRPRRHTAIYSVLVVLPLATLPFRIHADAGPVPESHPILWLFVVLVSSIGPSFFVLSTCASVFQRWFSMTDHASARDPYFLYAASNLGSLIALAAYPTLIEPLLPLKDQAAVWAVGYAAFAILTLCCIALVRRHVRTADVAARAQVEAESDPAAIPTWSRRARWVLLAFVPSSLMLGVTSYMSTDIAAVPLLWIVPLWLYLATFVVTFGTRGDAALTIARRALPFLILPLALAMIGQMRSPLSVVIPLHLLVFFAAALLCHGELAHDRPSPRFLTEFYFCLALGGMAGGLFNTLLAPVAFNRILEYPLALGLACLFLPASEQHERRWPADLVLPLCVATVSVILIAGGGPIPENRGLLMGTFGVLAVLAFRKSGQPVPFAASVGLMLCAGAWFGSQGMRLLHAERTFFGVYRVSVDDGQRYHILAHGTTLHGMQRLDAAHQQEPLTYFHRAGPFGQAFAEIPQLARTAEVGVVGLGAGTMASYALPGQRWTFYEIDPAVERIARRDEYFTYLRACAERCRVVLGDARLSLAKAQPQQYGLIVLDAFSSDAIPMHLMTAEALALYVNRLAAHGVLAFHISNRHLSLGPVLARLAASQGLIALERRDLVRDGSWPEGKSESIWLLMARERADLGPIADDRRWVTPTISPATPLWTDDFSNILAVLRLR